MPESCDFDALHDKRKSCPTGWVAGPFGGWVHPNFAQRISELQALLAERKPEFVIFTGTVALYALFGKTSIRDWRGSTFETPWGGIAVGTWDPDSVLLDWSLDPSFNRDIGRVSEQVIGGRKPVPEYRIITRPTMAQCRAVLTRLRADADAGRIILGGDYETRAGHIACYGIAWSNYDAISIPFMCMENAEGYWTTAEEQELVLRLRDLLTHPNVTSVFQNGMYDLQYFQRWWGFVPNMSFDTMIAHHTLFPFDRKSLGYLSSIYCEHHVYWKDDGKTWEAKMDEDQLWNYNGLDCCRTREIAFAEADLITAKNFWPQVQERHRTFWLVLAASARGFRINHALKAQLSRELTEAFRVRYDWLREVTGQDLNPKSPKQLATFFFTDMGVPPVKNRKTGGVTTNDEALKKIGSKDPILGRICDVIGELRSLGVFQSTFVEAKTDWDGRMRSGFNVAGTETFRLASGQNAFDGGLNFQNIPSGDEANSSGYPYPNIRKLFLPDQGYEIADMDLDRADLQVVVWEAGDDELKEALRRGVDLHILNGLTVFNKPIPPLEELIEGHPNYPEHKKRYAKERQFAKAFIHGTNYGGGARTMAITAGITIKESETFQTRWFGAHPGIKQWHARTEKMLYTRRYVENKFGFRRYYFDRPDGLLPEALAWVPQSTVALVINRAWENIATQLPHVEVLSQVHDSLVMQYPIAGAEQTRERIKQVSRITIGYDDPLVIPVGLNYSTESWGHCK